MCQNDTAAAAACLLGANGVSRGDAERVPRITHRTILPSPRLGPRLRLRLRLRLRKNQVQLT